MSEPIDLRPLTLKFRPVLEPYVASILRSECPPDSEYSAEEIASHTAEVASIMVMAWISFLDLALDLQPNLHIPSNLLPRDEPELKALFRDAFASLPMDADAAVTLMARIGPTVVNQSNVEVKLPLGMSLHWRCAGGDIELRRTLETCPACNGTCIDLETTNPFGGSTDCLECGATGMRKPV